MSVHCFKLFSPFSWATQAAQTAQTAQTTQTRHPLLVSRYQVTNRPTVGPKCSQGSGEATPRETLVARSFGHFVGQFFSSATVPLRTTRRNNGPPNTNDHLLCKFAPLCLAEEGPSGATSGPCLWPAAAGQRHNEARQKAAQGGRKKVSLVVVLFGQVGGKLEQYVGGKGAFSLSLSVCKFPFVWVQHEPANWH